MATFIREHTREDFAAILAEINRKPVPVNYDRRDAGKGRSQAFGLQRRWSYRPYLSRNCWMRPELWALLQEFAQKFVPAGWDAVQVNDNYKSAPHKDKGNHGQSYIVSFGDYTGGKLCLDPDVKIDTNHQAWTFNGSEITHWTDPWEGRRLTLVFYKIVWPTKFLPAYAVTSRQVQDGLEVSDDYDESVMVVNRRGHIVRLVKLGLPREYVGKLSTKGQPSRLANIPASAGNGDQVSDPSVFSELQDSDTSSPSP